MKKYTICWTVEYTNVQKIEAENLKEAIDKAEDNINFDRNPLSQNFKICDKHVYDFTIYDEGMRESYYDSQQKPKKYDARSKP